MSQSDLLHLINSLANYPALETVDEPTRKQLLESIEKLRRKVETPTDFTILTAHSSSQMVFPKTASQAFAGMAGSTIDAPSRLS